MVIFHSYVSLPEGSEQGIIIATIYESTNLPSANLKGGNGESTIRLHQDVNEFRDFPCFQPLTINAGVFRDFTSLLSEPLSEPLGAEFQGLLGDMPRHPSTW